MNHSKRFEEGHRERISLSQKLDYLYRSTVDDDRSTSVGPEVEALERAEGSRKQCDIFDLELAERLWKEVKTLQAETTTLRMDLESLHSSLWSSTSEQLEYLREQYESLQVDLRSEINQVWRDLNHFRATVNEPAQATVTKRLLEPGLTPGQRSGCSESDQAAEVTSETW